MDIRRLQHLKVLAEERHFARAAKRVNLSQPALSRSIIALEAEVGARLFDRSAGDVALTPVGVFLLERAERVLFEMRALQHELAHFRDGGLGDSAFGVGPFAAATVVPDVLITMRRRYPGVCLRVEVSAWHVLVERLLLEDLEFFIADVRELGADARLRITPIGRQVGRFYVRSGHPLAGSTPPLAALFGYGVVSVSLPEQIKASFAHALGVERAPIALECDDINLLKSVALATDSVLAATDIALQDELRDGRMVAIASPELGNTTSKLGLVTLNNRSPSPIAQAIIAAISARVPALADEPP